MPDPDSAAAETPNDVVVIGASAGGVETLRGLVSKLPADFPGAIAIVVHTSATGPNLLAGLLQRVSSLPVETAQNGRRLEMGHVYVAPSDHHLLVRQSHLELTRGAAENGHRPAADVLFRSAAHAYEDRVIGVVLTGYLDDGVAGLLAIKKHGGTAVVQDPNDALVSGMPQSAIDNVKVDHIAPAREIPALLSSIIQQKQMGEKHNVVRIDRSGAEDIERTGAPSSFSCPQCNGVLWELGETKMMQFRCRVGHSFSPESMSEAQDRSVDSVLWAALRALEERAELAARLAERAGERKQELSRQRFLERAAASSRDARILRRLLSLTSGSNFQDRDAQDPSSMREEA